MIYQVLGAGNISTTDSYVRDWAPRLRGKFHLIPSEQLPNAERLPVGTFLFTDLDKQTRAQRTLQAQLYDQLAAYGPPMRLLNHPLRAKNRQELLDALHAQGINSYRGFSGGALPSEVTYPVFIRVARDHHGTRTHLLHSRSEWETAMVRLAMEGLRVEELITIEFCDVADQVGIYHRYTAYRVGDRIVPRSIGLSTEWQVKGKDYGTTWRADLKLAYVHDNPHAAEVMEVFRAVEIEYGRVDYGMKDGRIQVWEINTCPLFSNSKPGDFTDTVRRDMHQFCADRLAEAFEEIGQPVSDARVPVKLTWPD